MKWFKSNIMALCIALLLVATELCYLPIFDDVILIAQDGIVYKLSDALYYINVHIGNAGLIPLIILYRQTKSIESKTIYMNLMAWVVFELFQQCNILFSWNLEVLNMYALSVSDRMQIIMCILVVILTYLGHRKWSTLSTS